MMIIGCDFHPSWQQVSWLDTETGETGEQKLVQASGDAERFYRRVAAPALIGHGSHRQLSLAGGFAGRVGPRVVGGRCGADSCQLRAVGCPILDVLCQGWDFTVASRSGFCLISLVSPPSAMPGIDNQDSAQAEH